MCISKRRQTTAYYVGTGSTKTERWTALTAGLGEEVNNGAGMGGLGERGRVSLYVNGVLCERVQVMQHHAHVSVITNVHRHVHRLPASS